MDAAQWLERLGLARYVAAFGEHNVDLDVLADLTDADLERIGVAPLGDRKRLLKAIAALAIERAATQRQAPPQAEHETTIGTPAERRHLTVMFCDLVGSTALASRLDPEEYRRVLDRFHTEVGKATAQFDGHLAQLLGDGALVYFGYPRAHEDDASRAVRAALSLQRALVSPDSQGPTAVSARIGIATGQVVVGDMGTGTPAVDRSASGETPNLAARLQALAGAGEIVVSHATRRLLEANFSLSALGETSIKGFDAPIQAWRVESERALPSRFDAWHAEGQAALIGRDSELALLLERWALACDGEAQVVLLQGDAGIGKSRIGEALRERLACENHAAVMLQCSPYFSSSALYPVVQHLNHAAAIGTADPPAERARKLIQLAGPLPPESLDVVLRLMGIGEEPGVADALALPGGPTPAQQRVRTLRALVQWLAALSRERPVLLRLEDAHWIDPTTEELVASAIEQLRTARLLVLVTSRPESTPTLGKPAHLTHLMLNRLGRRHCAALVDAVADGRPITPALRAEIIRRTDGVPLFIEELTKTVMQSGSGDAQAAQPEQDIPATLQDSLMARIDRLPKARLVAQVAAAIGREFSYRLLCAVMQDELTPLDAAIGELVEAELLYSRGAEQERSYTFKHALVRDTAYSSMLKSQRVWRHRQIAIALEQTEAETVQAQPGLLAHHWQEAGETQRAAELWSAAGKNAVSRASNREAAVFFERSLALLEALPDTESRARAALDIRLALGTVLFGLHGDAPMVNETFRQAQAMAERLGDRARLYKVLWGLYYVDYMAGRFTLAAQSANRLLQLAGTEDGGSELIEAHHARWAPLLMGGRPLEALLHLERGAALYEPARHGALRYQYAGHDPGACCSAWQAVRSWITGYPDRAELHLGALRDQIHALQHPVTNILLVVAAWVHYRRGDTQAAAQLGAELLEIAERHGFAAWAESSIVLRALAPDADKSPASLRALGRQLWSSRASKSGKTLMSGVLADLCLQVGAFDVLEEVVARMLAEEANLQSAELQCLQGALLLAYPASDPIGAEQRFRAALDIANSQGARSFELRAATSLAELWRDQGRHDDARNLLGPVYGWFTEGFETSDLRRARRLLEALGAAA